MQQLGRFRELRRCTSGNRLGQIEQCRVFSLAKILGLEQLRQTNDVRAFGSGLVKPIDGALQILVGIGRRRHLHQTKMELLRQKSSCDEIA